VKEKAGLSTRVRVALTITELNVGGAERCLTSLALGLDAERFEPQVYSLGPRPVGAKAALVLRLEQAGIPIHFLNLSSPRQFPAGLRQLKELFVAQAPDVVQTFLFHANVMGVWAARRARTPAVAMGIRVADPRRSRLWLERLAARRADRIVCVSRAVADFVIKRGRFPAEKVVVIPNGLDPSIYENIPPAPLSELGVAPGRRVLSAIGRLDRQKGLDWLLTVAPMLLESLPEHDIVVVGDGPERVSLEQRAQNLNLTGRVHFCGWRADVPSILAASEALLLPSRWEGMPNVVLEAMASGLPVVATRSEGVEELLGPAADLQTAFFGESEVFASKAIRIATDRTLAKSLGDENANRLRSQFSQIAMIAGYEENFLALMRELG
jgi:glycosyltransferase involved in cell wall biosynthesis